MNKPYFANIGSTYRLYNPSSSSWVSSSSCSFRFTSYSLRTTSSPSTSSGRFIGHFNILARCVRTIVKSDDSNALYSALFIYVDLRILYSFILIVSPFNINDMLHSILRPPVRKKERNNVVCMCLCVSTFRDGYAKRKIVRCVHVQDHNTESKPKYERHEWM